MKNFLIVLLLSIVGISGCKKKSATSEDTNVVDVDSHFQGTWYTTSQKTAYFNGSTEVNEEQVGPGIKYTITGNEIKLNYTNGVVERATYTLSKSGDKNFVTIVLGGVTQTYEITSITEQVMDWVQEGATQANGANKKVISIEFHCPCR